MLCLAVSEKRSHSLPECFLVSTRRCVLMTLATGVMSLLITPFMIHHLGDFQFGIYTLAFSSVGYFDLLAEAIRTTLQRFVGRISNTPDRETLNSIFSTALALSITVGLLIIIMFTGLSRLLPSFFKFAPVQQHLFAGSACVERYMLLLPDIGFNIVGRP